LLLPAILLTSIALLTGCGPGGLPVEGKVVNGEQPYAKATDGDVSLGFSPVDGQGGSGTAKVNDDGTFKVTGPEGGGIKAGKYNVNATIYPASADASKGPPTPQQKKLPEPVEITGSAVTIDLAKMQSATPTP
jgi:hypothetical protein